MKKITRIGCMFFMAALLSVLTVFFAPEAEDTLSRGFALPTSLLVIEEEAFMGTGLENVVIPEGTERIESRAFAGNRSMKTVTIPESVYAVSADAFDGANGLVIMGESGSYAERWARIHGVAFLPADRVIEFRVSGSGPVDRQESLGAGNSVILSEAKEKARFRDPDPVRSPRSCEKAKMHPIDLVFP